MKQNDKFQININAEQYGYLEGLLSNEIDNINSSSDDTWKKEERLKIVVSLLEELNYKWRKFIKELEE